MEKEEALKILCEDYVSFETAKLLREKGFDEPTTKSYYTEGFETPMKFSHDLLPRIQTDEFLCPTLQMVMKWLREVHNLHINIFVTWKDKIPHYQWSIDNLITQNTTYDTPCLEKYEEACETAIKYCLENLI